MSRFAIDARAAVRPELGGVERWARELAARLPALAPGEYEVLAPPRALAHRAGHAWERGDAVRLAWAIDDGILVADPSPN